MSSDLTERMRAFEDYLRSLNTSDLSEADLAALRALYAELTDLMEKNRDRDDRGNAPA